MATAKKDLEILVESITLDPGVFSGKSRRIADFKIVCPRLSIAQKTSSKVLSVADGKVVKPEWTTWTDRILFKESVQGTFGLELSFSERVSEKDLENAVSSSASTLVKLFGDLAANALGIRALNAFAELPANGLSKLLSGSSYSTKTIATGAADIPGEVYGVLKAGEGTSLSVPLVASRDIVKEKSRSTKTRSNVVSRQVVVREGDKVGEVTLRLSAL